ncbi:MAG: SET domain-containing protein-lysine N-methyltransferase [Chloroflexi bacterium]|nr:SET domain-containing protein-lysine N-methyltransferase [Chloroflexota bacterium]
MTRRYLLETWIDPRQDIRPSDIHGLGIFAREPVRQGEPIEIIGGDLMTDDELRAFQQITGRFNAMQIDEDLHLVEHPAITQQRLGSMNHACDSNLWLADEVTLMARRDIAADEELTVDYALFSAQPDWVMDSACRCGSPFCRGVITGNDWKLKEVQERYRDHFTPFLNARIARLMKNE